MNLFTPIDSLNHKRKKMKNKNAAILSPYALFLFRLFAIALAALIISASVNACPICDKAQPRVTTHRPSQSLNPLTRSRLTMVSACVAGNTSSFSLPPSQVWTLRMASMLTNNCLFTR